MKIQTQSCVINGKYDVAVVAQEVEYQGQGTLVKISRGGICGSDLHYYQEGKVGNFQVRQPMVLGHEAIGEVVASDSPRLTPGQKVALNPSKPCGECKYCLAQQQNQCTGMRFFGSAMYFPHVDGAFTQYKIVDSAQCISFEADRDDKVMVFAEPLAVAIHAAKQPGDVAGKKAFVSGVGPIGCLLVAALKALGAAEIVCADLSPRCLAIAGEMGAGVLLHAANDDFSAYLQDKGYFDIAFEAAGHPSSLQRCLEITRAKGTVVQVGMGGSFPDFPLMLLIAKELNLLGSFRFVEEFELAVAWLANGAVDPLPLLSAEFDNHQLAQALEFAGDKSRAAKVQLVF
ncbi:L-idonate 5-dehydrogenase [Serratia entomophila]|uniref:L-idonate 5-dehydrogenase n=1 Tax=Serratia entomophila TaxID=42906 RepID=UPI002178F98F|nr:L-idonate 5-dehydrogenase [Serratia entomophila]CAI0709921.1 L-idonate 5-dehydrogenase [Serratia entomophila]CAI0869467.1 L-idonate 5-dehydrogenase [Serratia entomophila]CAI1554558.1 L-idonate 5-dehydrogenase [Serratia entomophila]CAI1685163.1 L-idonate 5-dehydrogenase [Serratia entomophila]CAI1700768.1 L-idonate 5-dehydrogenase [Serratia entomophila]